MMPTTPAALMLIALLAPFVAFLLALRFIPQQTRAKMFAFDVPGWRSLPAAVKRDLFAALYFAGLVFIGRDAPGGALSWLDLLGWALAIFFLGSASGRWRAGREVTGDRS